MTLAFDAATEQQRSASAATTTVAHTAGSGVKGIAVAFVRGGAATTISSVSYGGTTLVQVNKASDTTTEAGSAEWWFAAHATSGNQNVSYNASATGSNIHVVVVTVTGAGAAYVQGQRTVAVDNTTSHSVSLTTGYVSGMAFGAFYGGGANPVSYTYGTDITLVADWDMGAFYSEVMRHQTAVTSPAYRKKFGGYGAASDDVAFAAIYLTDGGVLPGVGAPAVSGLAPTLLKFQTVAPGLGAATAAGLQPGIYAPNTHEPTLWRELKQPVGLGSATMGSLAVTLTTEGGTSSATALPGVGSAVANPLAPTLKGERTIAPGVGLAAANVLAPTALKERTVLPGVGSAALGALAATITVVRTVTPGVGSIASQGASPAVTGTVVSKAPGVGAVAVNSLAPTVKGERTVAPGLGAITTQAQQASLTRELKQAVGVGSAVAGGLVPELVQEFQQPGVASPNRAVVTTGGLAPTLLEDGAIGPSAGLATAAGLAPTLATERAITPDVGLSTAAGLAPTLSGDLVVTATIEPLVGILYTAGAPHVVYSGEVRGHVGTGRRWRTRYYGETSLGDQVSIVADVTPPEPLPPDPPAVIASVAPAIEASEVASMAARIERLEVEAARRIRRRREEEALIAFLMRVA